MIASSRFLLPLSAVAASLLAVSPAQGVMLYEQTFEGLNAGPLGTAGGLQGVGGAGNVAVVGSPGVSYSNSGLAEDGGNQSFTVTAWNSGEVGFFSTAGAFAAQTGDVYFSYIYSYAGTLDANSFNWMSFGNTVGSYDSSLGVVQRNGALQARIRPGTTNTNATGFTFEPGTYLIAGRITKTGDSGANYDAIEFWTNPITADDIPLDPSEYANASSLVLNSGIATISSFRFVIGNQANQYPGSIRIDNVRLGTTWSSVVTPVPEVGTTASLLLGLTAIGLACGWNRRRRGATR